MPPKASQKAASKTKPRENVPMTTAFKKLCEHLRKAKKTEGSIGVSDATSLCTLKTALRSMRQKSTNLEPKYVVDIVSSLDDDQSNVCRRLDAPIIGIIAETILQSDHCIQSERGLFLLASSLQYDGDSVEDELTNAERKSVIGRICLEILLSYFVDMSNPPTIRRWVGILCIRLLHESGENVDKLENMPEDTRRGIGKVMIQADNEMIRIICGMLLRELENAGLSRENLWPVNIDNELYENFPESTPNNTEWSQGFQTYVGIILERTRMINSNTLYVGVHCGLIPKTVFGTKTSKVNILITNDHMTLLPFSMDQLLDIPYTNIRRMTAVFSSESQTEGVAQIYLALGSEIPCVLDGQQIDPETVTFSTYIDYIGDIRKELASFSKDIQFSEEYRTLGPDDDNAQSQSDLDPADSPAKFPPSSQEPEHELSLAPEISSRLERRGNSRLIEKSIEDDIYTATPPRKSNALESQDEVDELIIEPAQGVPKNGRDSQTAGQKRRNRMKLKAKPPILSANQPEGLITEASQVEKCKSIGSTTDKAEASTTTTADATKIIASSAKVQTHFNSEPLSNVEANDASTPRQVPEKDDCDSIPKKELQKGARPSFVASHTSYQKVGADVTREVSQKVQIGTRVSHKTTSLKPAKDIFELPDYDDEYEPPKSKRSSNNIAKASSKSRKSVNTKSKLEPDKRQSAPVVIEGTASIKSKQNKDKRKSAPPFIERMTPPRATRSTINKGKAFQEADIKSQDVGASLTRKIDSVVTEQIVEDHDNQEHDSPLMMHDDPIGTASSLAGVFEELPLTMPRKNPMEDNKLGRSSGMDMASKLAGMLNFMIDDKMDSPAAQAPLCGEKQAETAVRQAKLKELSERSKALPQSLVEHIAKADDFPSQVKIQKALENPVPAKDRAERNSVGDDLEHETPTRLSPSPMNNSCDSNESKKRKAVENEAIPMNPPKSAKIDILRSESIGVAKKTLGNSENPSSMLQTPALAERGELKDRNKVPRKSRAEVDSQEYIEAHAEVDNASIPLALRPIQKANKVASTPSRRSPRLDTRGGEAAEKAQNTPLVDDRLTRKPRVISFGKQGALNQGGTTRFEHPVDLPKHLNTSPESMNKTEKRTESARKRKHGEVDLRDTQILRKKQQKSSPSQHPSIVNYPVIDHCEDNGEATFGSSPPSIIRKLGEDHLLRQLRQRHSSQASRVDSNGSPHASPSVYQVDHFSKVQHKLNDAAAESEERPLGRELLKPQHVFASRVRVSGPAKARPAAPESSPGRYIAHRKTRIGHYEGVTSKEVIQPQGILPDPFVDKARIPSHFTEHLRSRGNQKATHLGTVARGGVQVEPDDPEKTLVNAEDKSRIRQHVPSLSSCSSSSEISRSPLEDLEQQEMWNAAVRPHYATFSQAAHRIVDEVFIRLEEEENKMALLVDEYKENGGKILDSLAQKRTEEKSEMVKSLGGKKSVTTAAFKAAKQSVARTATELKQRSLVPLEKQWRAQQRAIRQKIGREDGVTE